GEVINKVIQAHNFDCQEEAQAEKREYIELFELTSSGKSAHAEEPSHTAEDSGMQHDQEFVTRDNDEQPADKEVIKANWFKKPKRPL
nr:hypothetical protein [Tanacetum cinerariifolium]